ncbi:MAG: DEAD/DEAH box helicase, partial [Collinsella sp.]|nr:DEAD/DEAH box helicase [Collinsella sp.]
EVVPYAHTAGEHLVALRQALLFSLSDEQEAAFQDILHDMCDDTRVMNRLLLGDVGTGKTAVAACALAVAVDSGTQACVMAPTGVLARQHADKTGPLLSQAGMSWALLTGATPAAERELIHSQLESGELDVLFGTHAVLSEDVNFKHLSLVVIDEQHRFGVGQRNALRAKGPGADLLVMTATPIPRTLELSVYGDLDTSIIRHRPVQGAGVTTRVLTESSRDLAYGAIREAHEKGQQAYVICPLVEPSDSADELEDVPGIARDDEGRVTVPVPLHDTATELDRLRLALPGLTVERLHGRMRAGEKDRVIDAFKRGEIDVLVSTTVVEVGVDVPNATVMVIENGERFGLAALHQLRGRVGRGTVAGTCLVMTHSKGNGGTSAAQDRLQSLEKTADGFTLAQMDLRLRHEGEILGYRQHGGVTLRFVDLDADEELIEWAHLDAVELLRYASNLDSVATRPLRDAVAKRYRHIFKEVSGG